MTYLDRADAALASISAQHRLRNVALRNVNDDALDFSSNDYLALSTDPNVVAAFRHARRVGSGGSRLLGGAHREHSLLEEELAQWLGRERVLLFSSGYHAAIGAVSVLAQTVDAIYSDERNHASLIDGIRLTRVPRTIYPHRRVPARHTSALVVTESIFSMDGDIAHIGAMVRDLGDDDVLLVDEAHALGTYGHAGAGVAGGIDDPRVVVIGTLSKAFGCHGGFVAGPARAIELLVNAARTFIFDTALPPAIALAARIALVAIRNGDTRRTRLHENAERMRLGLRSLGCDVADDPTPIVPVVLGDETRALSVADALARRRIVAPAIRPPTVPPHSSRLRLCIRADHATEHIDLFLEGLATCIATS